MIYFLLSLNFLLMIAMPLALGWFIARRRGASWRLFGIGAVTFIAAQVFHIPFNFLVDRSGILPEDLSIVTNLVIVALFLGLSAGVFEEGARYLTYRYWARDARTWGKGLMLGAGHGGVESIIVGLLGGINFVALAAMRSGALLEQMPAEQLPLVEAQIEALFATPLHLALLGAVERIFALTAHLALSLMVMQVFTRGRIRWLLAAILWHTLLNAVAVFAINTWNAVVTEALIGVIALLSLGIIFWLREPEPIEEELEPLPEAGPAPPLAAKVTEEALDRSRYS